MRFLDLDKITAKHYLLMKRFDSKYNEFFQDLDKYTDIEVLQMIYRVSRLDFSYNEWNPSQKKFLKFRDFEKPASFETHEDVASFIGSCITYIKNTDMR